VLNDLEHFAAKNLGLEKLWLVGWFSQLTLRGLLQLAAAH